MDKDEVRAAVEEFFRQERANLKIPCKQCGEPFHPPLHESSKQFCTYDCMVKYQEQVTDEWMRHRYPNWRRGGSI